MAEGRHSLAVRTALGSHVCLPEVSDKFASALTYVFHLFTKSENIRVTYFEVRSHFVAQTSLKFVIFGLSNNGIINVSYCTCTTVSRCRVSNLHVLNGFLLFI